MSFSSMLRVFSATDVFIAIRASVNENYRPTRTPGLVFDPWFGSDPTYGTAWAGVQGVSW